MDTAEPGRDRTDGEREQTNRDEVSAGQESKG